MKSAYLDLLAKYGIDGAHPGGLPLTRKLLDELNINFNTRLLDLGCGTGQTLEYISKIYSCTATGVDNNEQMLFKAAQRFRRENLAINLVYTDVTHLPFPSNSFDIALSESVTIFTDINKALCEYARILDDNGIFLAIEMTAEYPLAPQELYEVKSVYGIEQVPTLEEWRDGLLQAGFKDIQSYSVRMIPTIKFTSHKMIQDFSPHLRLINRYSRKLCYRVYRCRKQYNENSIKGGC